MDWDVRVTDEIDRSYMFAQPGQTINQYIPKPCIPVEVNNPFTGLDQQQMWQ